MRRRSTTWIRSGTCRNISPSVSVSSWHWDSLYRNRRTRDHIVQTTLYIFPPISVFERLSFLSLYHSLSAQELQSGLEDLFSFLFSRRAFNIALVAFLDILDYGWAHPARKLCYGVEWESGCCGSCDIPQLDLIWGVFIARLHLL